MVEKSNLKQKQTFLPKGRAWFIVVLLGVVAASSILYAQKQLLANLGELQSVDGRRSASSTSMRSSPGFDLKNASIPVNEIFSGGPPKDGIPSLTKPNYISASQAVYLKDEDRVVGVSYGGEHRAYPLKVLDFHEAVNDSLDTADYSVTYCPLCDSVTVFDRPKKDGSPIEFGISGLLYNSNVLIYDRHNDSAKESLWSQMKNEAVSGAALGESLKVLPYQLMSWADWKTQHPDTLVLSDQTGYPRKYDGSVYHDYFASDQLMFPVSHEDDRLPAKARVLGVQIGDQAKAYPIDIFDKQKNTIRDTINGVKIEIEYSPLSQDVYLKNFPEQATVINCFWFAWAAFYPDTEIYEP